MPHRQRFSIPQGRAALLAAACLTVPLAAKPPASPEALTTQELATRRAAVEEAQMLTEKGDGAYQAGQYADAVTAFTGARELLPVSPLTAELRAATTERLVQASVARARQLSRQGDVAGAKAAVEAVLADSVAPNDTSALAMRQELDDPIRTNPALTKEHATDVEAVRKLLYTAEGAYNLGKFDEAKKHYHGILRIDPTNTAARRGLEQVAAAITTYQKSASDHTRAEMLGQVDGSWELPLPPELNIPTEMAPQGGDMIDVAMPLSHKLTRLIIPHLQLGGASLQDAIDLLRMRAAELDTLEPDPTRRGVNFNLELGDSATAGPIQAVHFDLQLAGVPLSKALDYITAQTKTTWTTDEYSVIIRPQGLDSKEVITRTYRVPPSFRSTLDTGGPAKEESKDPFATAPGKSLLSERRSIREIFEEIGIKFPAGTNVQLNGTNLTVSNTASNHNLVAQLVESTARTEPVMVSIRVDIIKCQQNRLRELGFDWLLSPVGLGADGWIPGTKTLNLSGGSQGNGGDLSDITLPPGQSQRNPITAGNRSGDEAITRDSIDAFIAASNRDLASLSSDRAPGAFAITKLFDDGSAQSLMRAMARSKGVDVLNVASVLTHNGQEAVVKVTKEMRYPEEYEPPEVTAGSSAVNPANLPPPFNNLPATQGSPPMVTPAHPSSFADREVGIVLQVTPTADDAKRFVDLALAPTMVEFDGFVNYGTPINLPADPNNFIGNLIGGGAVRISDNRILKPVFSVNRLLTNITVLDGTTIAIGGLLEERIQDVNDSTQFLGDIPIFGRLFQSSVRQPVSTAVIFLVHVELLDPTGKRFNNY